MGTLTTLRFCLPPCSSLISLRHLFIHSPSLSDVPHLQISNCKPVTQEMNPADGSKGERHKASLFAFPGGFRPELLQVKTVSALENIL